MSNLSWGMQFRTCKNFWDSAGFSLAFIPKILTNTKAIPPLLRLFVAFKCRFCDSALLGGLEFCRVGGFFFLQKQKEAKTLNKVFLLDSANLR